MDSSFLLGSGTTRPTPVEGSNKHSWRTCTTPVLALGIGALATAAGPIGTAAIAAGFEGFVVGGAAGAAVGTIGGAFTSAYGIGDIESEC